MYDSSAAIGRMFLERDLKDPAPLLHRGVCERSIRSATPARWVMARDVTPVAGPPEIHGEEVHEFAWIVLINLRGLLRR
jgi:hypothetical protein